MLCLCKVIAAAIVTVAVEHADGVDVEVNVVAAAENLDTQVKESSLKMSNSMNAVVEAKIEERIKERVRTVTSTTLVIASKP
jgi:peroxiredoxin family protein